MTAETISAGNRRRRWRALTDHQRTEALRLTLNALSQAIAGSAAGVALVLRDAAAVSPATEEHVIWATQYIAPTLRLVGDEKGNADRYLTEGIRIRRNTTDPTQDGLFQ